MRYQVRTLVALTTVLVLVCVIIRQHNEIVRLKHPVPMSSTEALDTLQKKWRGDRREEQDDPEGSWAEIKVGDRIELSDPAITHTGVGESITENGINVTWLTSRDIFLEKNDYPAPDPFISRSMGISLIRTGWIDLLDY